MEINGLWVIIRWWLYKEHQSWIGEGKIEEKITVWSEY